MLPAILPELLSVTSIFKTGSPRYEGGPLISSVQERLAQVKAGDPAAISYSKSDAVSGGPGWKDVALVLAPAVRPDLLGNPSRVLTADEQGIVAPYLPGNPIPVASAMSTARTTTEAPKAATIGEQIASFFGFGPSQQQAAAVSAGTAAGAQVSSGLVKAAVIVALVVVAIVVLPKLVKRFA